MRCLVGIASQLAREVALAGQQQVDRKVVRLADHSDRLGGILDGDRNHGRLERSLRDPIGRHAVVFAVVGDGDDA